MPILQIRQLRLREDSLNSPSVPRRVSQSGFKPESQGLYCLRLDRYEKKGAVEGTKGGALPGWKRTSSGRGKQWHSMAQ